MKIIQNIGESISAHFQPGRLVHATVATAVITSPLSVLMAGLLSLLVWLV